MTYDLRDSEGSPVKVGDRVLCCGVWDDVPTGVVTAIAENDEGTHGSTTITFDDGVIDTFPNTWQATGPWDDSTTEFRCDEIIKEPTC